MVRLKGHAPDVIPGFHAFQFHYGTIKRLALSMLDTCAPLFQFHYGTIKSHYTDSTATILTLFQFHYGTIKSVRHGKKMAWCRNFNSTMVRLKVRINLTNVPQIPISIPLWYD